MAASNPLVNSESLVSTYVGCERLSVKQVLAAVVEIFGSKIPVYPNVGFGPVYPPPTSFH